MIFISNWHRSFSVQVPPQTEYITFKTIWFTLLVMCCITNDSLHYLICNISNESICRNENYRRNENYWRNENYCRNEVYLRNYTVEMKTTVEIKTIISIQTNLVMKTNTCGNFLHHISITIGLLNKVPEEAWV